ncbi:thiolase family protein [Nocardia yamanashiensis]|uniref:thiolase family protein n=1 Tax=Nocardia yamanashiensis TaxID=209247 RepID=UPI00082F7417|nr:thiolase family protein [Nocardia yamanashiensis]
MHEAVIVSAVRTPFTRAFSGALSDCSEFDLAKAVVRGAIQRPGLHPETIDEIALGEVYQGGGCIARYVGLDLGLPVDTPGVAIGSFCSSGMVAIQHAVAAVRSGMKHCVIAGGVTSVSVSADPATAPKTWSPSHPGSSGEPATDLTFNLGEMTARRLGLGRAEIDAWAYRSHSTAVAAIDDGLFEVEHTPVAQGDRVIAGPDELPRRDLDPAALAELEPVLGPGHTVTVGNQTGLTDGAAALAVCSRAYAEEYGLRPLAVIRGWASVGAEPNEAMGAGLVAARRSMQVAGLRADAVTRFEIHDSFAVLGLAFERGLDLDRDKINVLGGGLALGHPFAGSGARVAVTLVHSLRRDGGGTGVGVILGAGGAATALALEVPAA